MDRNYIEKHLQEYVETKNPDHLWRIASHADILKTIKKDGTLTVEQQGQILIWLTTNGFIATPNSQRTPYALHIEQLAENAHEKGLTLQQITDAILSIPNQDDGTKEFWSYNEELLDGTENWEFDYSDMGESESPQF